MGVKSTLVAAPPTVAHTAAAFKNGFNASALTIQLQEALADVIYLAKELIKTTPTVNLIAASNPSTSSPSITMAAPLPSSVVSGMNVFDITANKQIGTILSASASTLTLTGNASNAGSGTSDILQITDANLATYQGLVTSLS
jgi:hypothetical protein